MCFFLCDVGGGQANPTPVNACLLYAFTINSLNSDCKKGTCLYKFILRVLFPI